MYLYGSPTTRIRIEIWAIPPLTHKSLNGRVKSLFLSFLHWSSYCFNFFSIAPKGTQIEYEDNSRSGITCFYEIIHFPNQIWQAQGKIKDIIKQSQNWGIQTEVIWLETRSIWIFRKNSEEKNWSLLVLCISSMRVR